MGSGKWKVESGKWQLGFGKLNFVDLGWGEKFKISKEPNRSHTAATWNHMHSDHNGGTQITGGRRDLNDVPLHLHCFYCTKYSMCG